MESVRKGINFTRHTQPPPHPFAHVRFSDLFAQSLGLPFGVAKKLEMQWQREVMSTEEVEAYGGNGGNAGNRDSEIQRESEGGRNLGSLFSERGSDAVAVGGVPLNSHQLQKLHFQKVELEREKGEGGGRNSKTGNHMRYRGSGKKPRCRHFLLRSQRSYYWGLRRRTELVVAVPLNCCCFAPIFVQ